MKIAKGNDVSLGLNLQPNDNLNQLIKKISECDAKIKELDEYYEGDYFIPALIFLKLRKLHGKSINAEIFCNFVKELNAVDCNSDLISVGVSWYGAYYGYIEIRELYYEAKEYIFLNKIKINNEIIIINEGKQLPKKEQLADLESASQNLEPDLLSGTGLPSAIELYYFDKNKNEKLIPWFNHRCTSSRNYTIKYEDSDKPDLLPYEDVKKIFQEGKKAFIRIRTKNGTSPQFELLFYVHLFQ